MFEFSTTTVKDPRSSAMKWSRGTLADYVPNYVRTKIWSYKFSRCYGTFSSGGCILKKMYIFYICLKNKTQEYQVGQCKGHQMRLMN